MALEQIHDCKALEQKWLYEHMETSENTATWKRKYISLLNKGGGIHEPMIIDNVAELTSTVKQFSATFVQEKKKK